MFYVCSRGVKIAVYDPNPHGREPVLLLHGWPMTHDLYEYQTDLLIQSGYRPVLVDLRGFGKSDVPAVGYTYNDMAEDLHNVIQTLHLCGIILVGYGMGGGVALRYIRRHPGGGVKKLVLLAAGAPCWTERPGFPYGLPRQSATELIRLAMADRPQFADLFTRLLFANEHSEAALHWFRDVVLSASSTATIQSGYTYRDEDGREDLAFVHVPAAVFAGGQDALVPDALTDFLRRGIPGACLYTLPSSGHGLIYDERAAFNHSFLEFLKR